MGKFNLEERSLKDKELIDKILDNLDKKTDNFLDKKLTPWYKEAVKHFVPGYTIHRFSEISGLGVKGIGWLIEGGKLLGYFYGIKYLGNLL